MNPVKLTGTNYPDHLLEFYNRPAKKNYFEEVLKVPEDATPEYLMLQKDIPAVPLDVNFGEQTNNITAEMANRLDDFSDHPGVNMTSDGTWQLLSLYGLTDPDYDYDTSPYIHEFDENNNRIGHKMFNGKEVRNFDTNRYLKEQHGYSLGWKVPEDSPYRKFVTENITDGEMYSLCAMIIGPNGWVHPHIDHTLMSEPNMDRIYIPIIWPETSYFNMEDWGNLPTTEGTPVLFNPMENWHCLINDTPDRVRMGCTMSFNTDNDMFKSLVARSYSKLRELAKQVLS